MDKVKCKALLGALILACGLSPTHASIVFLGTDNQDFAPFYYVFGLDGDGGIAVDNGSVFTWSGTPATPPQTERHSSGIIFARRTGSTAEGSISGPGSTINLEGNNGPTFFQVGRGGVATFTIDNGGRLNVRDLNASPNTDANNSTSLNIGGSGSNFPPTDGTGVFNSNNGHVLIEGNRAGTAVGNGGGNGTLNLENSSTFRIIDHDVAGNAGAWMSVGAKDGSRGVVHIQDSSLSLASDSNDAGIQVGSRGLGANGSLTLSGASAEIDINAPNAFAYMNVGRGDGAFGQVTIDNSASINMNGNRSIFRVSREEGSIGTLTITNGGELNVDGADHSDVLIGWGEDHDNDPSTPRQGGTGIALVSGAGSSIYARDHIVVGVPTAAGPSTSRGTLIVTDGASITAGDGVLVGTGGLFTGSAFVNGDVFNDGGIVAPGDSPGTMTITGNYSQSATGVLQMEVNGDQAGEYDVLNVFGDLDLSEGVVDMIFETSFLEELLVDISLMPSLDSMFVASGIRTVDYNLIHASAEGYQMVDVEFDQNGRLTSVNVSVPIPSTILLMILGMVYLRYRQRGLSLSR